MLPIRNISYLLPMCCSFWEKCKNSPKTGLGCSTPLSVDIVQNSYRDNVSWKFVITSGKGSWCAHGLLRRWMCTSTLYQKLSQTSMISHIRFDQLFLFFYFLCWLNSFNTDPIRTEVQIEEVDLIIDLSICRTIYTVLKKSQRQSLFAEEFWLV